MPCDSCRRRSKAGSQGGRRRDRRRPSLSCSASSRFPLPAVRPSDVCAYNRSPAIARPLIHLIDASGSFQNELEHGGDEASTTSPRSQPQLGPHHANSSHLDQAKTPAIFSGAFPCPPRRSLPPYLAAESPAGGFFPGGAAFVSGDTAMDTHSDGPSQDLY